MNGSQKQIDWANQIIANLKSLELAGQTAANELIAKRIAAGKTEAAEKHQDGLAEWNSAWALFWETCERCDFNAHFYITFFKDVRSNPEVRGQRVNGSGAFDIFCVAMLSAGASANNPDEMRTFTPAAHTIQ